MFYKIQLVATNCLKNIRMTISRVVKDIRNGGKMEMQFLCTKNIRILPSEEAICVLSRIQTKSNYKLSSTMYFYADKNNCFQKCTEAQCLPDKRHQKHQNTKYKGSLACICSADRKIHYCVLSRKCNENQISNDVFVIYF